MRSPWLRGESPRGTHRRVASSLTLAWLAGFVFLEGCQNDPQSPESPTAPGILLVLVDDLRYDMIAALGSPVATTPHVDRLVREGTSFDQAFVITSLCSPSRATVLTGLTASEHGVESIHDSLRVETPTIATALQAEGFHTAWIGKWHLSPDTKPFPGFDRWVSFFEQGQYLDPEFDVDGAIVPQEGHVTDLLTGYALEFLRSLPGDRPFFLGVSHLAVHMPMIPQDRFDGSFDGVEIPSNPSVEDDLVDNPAFLDCRRWERDRVQQTRDYLEVLAGVDESLGELLAVLEQQERLEDTLVIFTSDNGFLLGEYGTGDKRVAYEPSIRIPLIVRAPDWIAGTGERIDTRIALNLDVGRTILDFAGLGPLPGMRGHSLADLASGAAERDRFLYTYRRDARSGDNAGCTPTISALRTLRHKVVVYTSRDPQQAEMYDLEVDPYETRNLWRDLGVRALRDSLVASMGELGAEMGWVP